jgi:hypothetical protein
MLAFCAAMCAHTLGAVHSEKDMIKGTNRRPVLTAKAKKCSAWLTQERNLSGQQRHIQAYVATLGSVPVAHAKKI